MNKIFNGVIAGFVATIILSAMMIVKGKMGVMPDLDIIAMLAKMIGAGAIVGWVMHFMVGMGYGIAFSQINRLLPAHSFILKGMMIGIAGWLMMMFVLMPMMGAGMFAMNMGMMAPIMTLVLHMIFGAVLGLTYSKLNHVDVTPASIQG